MQLRFRGPVEQRRKLSVGRVDDRVLQQREVDLRRAFRGVTHPGTDHRNRDVVIPGRRRPTVTGRVGGEPVIELQKPGEDLQLPVVVVQRRLVLREGLGGILGPQHRKHINRRAALVLVDDALHDGFDPYAQLLAGLVPRVADRTVTNVRLAQVGHVHEGHAPGAVAEDEEVPSPGQRNRMAQVELEQAGDDPFVDGPFAGGVDPGVDVPERVGLLHEVQPHGLVVDRAQDPHVERHGIPDHAALFEACAVVLDDLFGQGLEREVLAIEIGRQAVHCPVIVAGRAEAAAGFELVDLLPHEGQDRRLMLRDPELEGNLPDVVVALRKLEALDDPVQHRKVAFDPELHERIRSRTGYLPPTRLPLLGMQADRSRNLEHFAAVRHLVVDGACSSRDG